MTTFSLTTMLHDSFVKPFANKGLLGLYFSTVIGLAGQALIMIYMAYNLADEGINVLLSYYLILPILANVIFMPAGFYLFAKMSVKTLIAFVLVYQLIFFGGVLVLNGGDVIVVRTLMANAMNIPFWVLYHMSVLHYSSQKNRGNELSLAHLGISVGCILGSLAAGFFLNTALPRGLVLCLGTASTMLAVLSLLIFAKKNGVIRDGEDHQCKDMARDIWAIVRSRNLQSKATSLEMIYDTAVGALWPIWLKVIGTTGLMVGFLTALNVAIKCFLSPLVGGFINQGHGQEAQHGPLLKIIGWLPWLVFAQPLTALWSSVFFAAGSHMFKVGLEARWYKNRALAPMAAREVLLGVGRVFGAAIFIPVLFYAPGYFVPLGIAFTALVFLSGVQLRRSSLLMAAE